MDRSSIRRRRQTSTPCAEVERLSSRILFFGGDLDPTFSSDGMATYGTAVTGLEAVAVGSQSDGKVIVAGSASGGVYSNQFVVARFNVDGSLDTTFGTNGLAGINFSGEYRNPLKSVTTTSLAIQPDNKIVVGGWGGDLYNPLAYGLLARLDVNGALDPAFSGNGKMVLNPFTDNFLDGRYNYILDLKIQGDGKIIAAGTSALDGSSDAYAGVARLNPDGSPDTTFDGDGNRAIDVGAGTDMLEAVSVGSNGTITLAGSTVSIGSSSSVTSKVMIARLLPNGTPDNTFDGDGKLTTVFSSAYPVNSARDVTVQYDGKIVLACTVGTSGAYNMGVMRLNANGTRDTTFGTSNGQIEVDVSGVGTNDTASSIVIGKAGRFIVAGSVNNQMALFGLDAHGHYDNRFAGDGTLITSFAEGARASDLTVGYGGKVLAAGGPAMATARIIDRNDVTVGIGTFNPILKEQGATGSAFLVTREERVPYATRVYLTYSGSALARNPRAPRDVDLSISGLTFITGRNYYVDIPANSTYVSITLTPVDDADIEGDETASFTVTPDDAYDIVPTPTTTFYIRDNEGPPSVSSWSYDYLNSPNTLKATFSQDIGTSLTINDFQFTLPAGVATPSLSYSGYGNIATLTFGPGAPPDGNYTVTLPANTVVNAANTPNPNPSSTTFFSLVGDATRDRAVNFDDLLIVAKNYGQTGRTWLTGDFDYDGTCNFSDLLLLAKRYGTTLAMPAADVAPSPVRTRRTQVATGVIE